MKNNFMTVSENCVKFYSRAKYYITADGELKLIQVQQMNLPVFRASGFEEHEIESKLDIIEHEFSKENQPILEDDEESNILKEYIELQNKKRALRRARTNAFDKILCNPDLDAFVTLTIAPEAVADRTKWEDCYKAIKTWLNNRVTRKSLKYVMCAERHKSGGIHFHALMNREALNLKLATNAKTGEILKDKGQTLYNISDWKIGFSSVKLLGCTTQDREKVAKYIFKYMGKSGIDGMIGGRYLHSGGKLVTPIFAYGDNPEEFMKGEEAKYSFAREHNGIEYKVWNFV